MTLAEWTPIIVALITAGLLKYAADVVKWLAAKRKGQTTEGRQTASLSTADQTIALVARARDELESDNVLLRAMLQEERAASASREADLIQRHAAEMARRDAREADYRAEIARLERKVREILSELESLKSRHTGA